MKALRAVALAVAAFVVGVSALVVPRTAVAATQTYAEALSNCQADIAFHSFSSRAYCGPYQVTANSWSFRIYKFDGTRNTYCSEFDCSFTGGIPELPNACESNFPPTNIVAPGRITQGSSGCSGLVPMGDGSGAQVQCAININPIGAPTVDPNTGEWSTYTSVGASGNTCGGDSWTDGNGDAIQAPPQIADLPMVNVTAPPDLCTGSSCYDPQSDQYCATSGGEEFCVAGADARTKSGTCASGGSGTMCAGSPNAPSAPGDKVPDPATEIKASDNYMQADPISGDPLPVNVVIWATQGDIENGADPGDSVPAPASSSPDAPDASGSYSGGTNCDTPPVCRGDPVLCGSALTQWATVCQVHKDLAGTGTPPTLDELANGGDYDQGSLWVDQPAGNTVGDRANAGEYDMSGFADAPSQCPLTDLAVPLFFGQSFTIPFSLGCQPLGWLRWLVIGFALYYAAKITAGVKG